MPLLLTRGGITPVGILSMFEASLSFTLTMEGPIFSPTLNWTVTMPCPRWEAEYTCLTPGISLIIRSKGWMAMFDT